jgi:hypothetical protein
MFVDPVARWRAQERERVQARYDRQVVLGAALRALLLVLSLVGVCALGQRFCAEIPRHSDIDRSSIVVPARSWGAGF